MTGWKAQLESFDSLLKGLKQNREQAGKLRFGRSVIVASDIAEQFYCEKKVEMEYLHGEWRLKRRTQAPKLILNFCLVGRLNLSLHTLRLV
jgi:hypothetical protein